LTFTEDGLNPYVVTGVRQDCTGLENYTGPSCPAGIACDVTQGAQVNGTNLSGGVNDVVVTQGGGPGTPYTVQFQIPDDSQMATDMNSCLAIGGYFNLIQYTSFGFPIALDFQFGGSGISGLSIVGTTVSFIYDYQATLDDINDNCDLQSVGVATLLNSLFNGDQFFNGIAGTGPFDLTSFFVPNGFYTYRCDVLVGTPFSRDSLLVTQCVNEVTTQGGSLNGTLAPFGGVGTPPIAATDEIRKVTVTLENNTSADINIVLADASSILHGMFGGTYSLELELNQSPIVSVNVTDTDGIGSRIKINWISKQK
jgi:hypothetical protein